MVYTANILELKALSGQKLVT